MDKKLVARYILRDTLGVMVMGAALFGSAGRLDWWPAWAALGVMLAWMIATAILIFRANPGLIAERLGPRKGSKTWDTVILSMMGLLQLLRDIAAGLEQRYHTAWDIPLAVQMAALLACVLGYALFTWATASNDFFSQVVRIQSERSHAVATGGPYRWARHPAYLGAIVYDLAVAVLLASGWALFFGALTAVLLVLRTAFEDRTLQGELAGYAAYAQKVRYRLLPGIW